MSINKSLPNEAWIVARLDSIIFIKDEPADIYALMDVATGHAFPPLPFLGQLPSEKEFQAFFKRARKSAKTWPKTLYVGKEDPAELQIKTLTAEYGISLEIVPTTQIDPILQPLRKGFDRFQSGRSRDSHDSDRQVELNEAKQMIPDSYELCPCASGKKYKFCCKLIFREVIEAMVAAEEGNQSSALKWMDEAKAKVGETAEVLCRYGIIYSYKSEQEFLKYLHQALQVNPSHPRTHYLFGIHYKQKGDLASSAKSYETAIANYPSSDKYHLNETWNNLGTVRFDQDEFEMAKGAWEKALIYLPSDKTAKENLIKFIYQNPYLPEAIRKPSPFVARLF